MADIQSSLQRLQESIRGLSDASALVGALDVDIDVDANQDIFQEEQAGLGTSVSPPLQQPPAASSSPSKYHGRRHDEGLGGSGGLEAEPDRRSSLGSSGGPRTHDAEHQSMLSSIPREVRDSAELRAARELEDLRLEKESLQVMKQQLAAVHKLRVDLQRKDSVIQSLQLKVQEGQAARDREGRLEAHCHLLEKRCSYLESTNGEYAERLEALDQESRVRVDELTRDADDLKRQLRDSESELKAQERRYEGTVAAQRRELRAALAEADDARGLANELRESLQEASAQAKRRQGRWSEMEKLLTSQLDDTRASLKRAERRATATADVRRRDAEAAAAAASALSTHLQASTTANATNVEGGACGGEADSEAAKQEQHDSTATFVDLSGRWCGNEILALTWIEVSKALEALDAARLGHRTAVLALADSKRQVDKQQAEIGDARQALKDLREELCRLHGVEARVESTAAQLEAAREREHKRDRQGDAEWALLSSVGAIRGVVVADATVRRHGHNDADGVPGGRFGGRGGGGADSANDDEGETGPSTTAIDDVKGGEILEGIRLLISEWSDRGNGLETMRRRLREEGERRDEERGRLEKLVQTAEEEAGARGEELARMIVEFETRAACAEADMDEKVAKAQADAEADAKLRVSTAFEEAKRSVTTSTVEADRKVSEITSTADQKVAEATATADRKVLEATTRADEKVAEAEEDARRRIAFAVQEANKKTEDTDRRVAEAQEALALAKSKEAAAVALSKAAVEGQRGAEAALRVLGRFVGPLHRLCLELREQKRFLARSYRRDKPLQAELFAVAAAVSGKDYWCQLSSATLSDRGPSDVIRATSQRHGAGRISSSNNPGGGHGDEDLQHQWEDHQSAPDAVHVPPSLRAVVIAVLFASRLTASARQASAARANYVVEGGGGKGAAAEARLERRQRHRQQVGGGGPDSRYLTRAGGLPVLPPGWCGAKGRPLRMPSESELEAMPDDKALETVLTRLLVFGGCGDGDDQDHGSGLGNEKSGGDGVGDGFGGGRGGDGDGSVRGAGVMSSGGFDGGGALNSLNVKALWGGGGARVGDLLYHLLRGRKDHMTRVKERGLALDPRPPRLWRRRIGGVMLASPELPRDFAPDLDGARGGGRMCRGAAGGNFATGSTISGWRVKLGRAVRLELERSVWLGEGPGQPGSLHLRDIRKALAALARELNDSEAKRLQIEQALSSAGGGVGLAELEESADVLRRRVEVLEAEVAAKPVVDVDAFGALEDDLKTATAVAEGLRAQVDHLEADLATARGEVSDAVAASHRANTRREEAEERAGRLNDSKLELMREVEQLKAFAIRANLEREECLEKERALARERVDETLHASPTFAARRERNSANPSFFSKQHTRVTRRDGHEVYDDVHACNDDGIASSPLPRQCQPQREILEDSVESSRRAQTQRQQEDDETRVRESLARSQEELRRRRNEEGRSRARCMQLEARLVEARDRLEEQKGVTASMRRAAARAHGDAEAARKEARETEARMSRQKSECRRQLSVLEARLLETGVKDSRRRDLLQLQACAQEDLAKALTEEAPGTPSTCGETGVGGASDDGRPQEQHEEEERRHEEAQAFGSLSQQSRSRLRVTVNGQANGTR
eukprot:g7484.t2